MIFRTSEGRFRNGRFLLAVCLAVHVFPIRGLKKDNFVLNLLRRGRIVGKGCAGTSLGSVQVFLYVAMLAASKDNFLVQVSKRHLNPQFRPASGRQTRSISTSGGRKGFGSRFSARTRPHNKGESGRSDLNLRNPPSTCCLFELLDTGF